MNDVVLNQRCVALSDELGAMAQTVVLRDLYWINTPNGDLGSEWCRGCGRAKVRNLRNRDRRRRQDYLLDGGWRTDHDGPRYCEGCGVALDGALTREGALSELDNYAHWGVWPGRSDEALRLMETLDALAWTRPSDSPLAEEAADIAEAFLWSAV